MPDEYFEIEPFKPFAKSLIWQLNREFYQDKGISAWSDNVVPHHMTSNSQVGKTYAELILAFLSDLAAKGKTEETVYILELGSGHGRLAFHMLQHLERLAGAVASKLPPYCYVLSDIAEENLTFFRDHPQFQSYFRKGNLDLSYFDATASQEIYLRYAETKICERDLNQPILVIANYFFDSIPNDLFFLQEGIISACSVALRSKESPANMSAELLIENMELSYHKEVLKKPFYDAPIFNEMLEDYRSSIVNTHLFFPEKGMQCLTNLRNLSSEGLLLLSMDKGFHEIHDLEKNGEPDIVTHGSFSLWVNFHGLGTFCEKQGGKALFPTFSTFHLDIACLLFLSDSESYVQTQRAYQHFVNDFGPDDFTSIKDMAYFNVSRLTIKELIALFRLSAYDSTFFIKLLPRLKQVLGTLTFNERRRVEQSLHEVWRMYFNINEEYDLAYELGGMLYDLGFYTEALTYFQFSVALFGQKADIYYNRILCYYQLRQDQLFFTTLHEAKQLFPQETVFDSLDSLDMNTL